MKKILVIVLLAVIAATGWYWWSHRSAGDAGTLALHGNVDIRQVSLAFDGGGRILELRAEEGDAVTAGQAIGLLDTRTLALQAEQAEAQVNVQRQTLLRLRNGARPEEIAQVRAQLASAQATATRAEQDFSRASRLQATASGAISEQGVDLARSEAEAARARVEEVRAALRLAEAGPRTEEIGAAEAQLAAAEASLALLRHQIDQGTLRAPVNAVVRSRLLEPGDITSSQRAVFALALTELRNRRHTVVAVDVLEGSPFEAEQDSTLSRMWALQRHAMYRDMGIVGVDVVPWPSTATLDQALRLIPVRRRAGGAATR